MADYDVTANQTVDAFILSNPGYNNTQFTLDQIFVSEAATLSQTVAEIEATLYVTNLILGENSTGTAIIKQGYVDFPKPGFTLYLVPGVPAPVDVVAPAAAGLTAATATQNTDVVLGRTVVTILWDPVLTCEALSEDLGPASGSAQTIDLVYEPVLVASETVLEITGTGATSTTLDEPFDQTHDILRTVSSVGFLVGDYIYVDDGSSRRYYEISDINGNEITVTTECNLDGGFAAGADVQQVTALVKTSGVDYAMDYVLGSVSLVAGQFTPGNEVVILYTPMIQDLDHFEIFRVDGDLPVTPSVGHSLVTRDDVLADPTVVTVDLSIASTALSYSDTAGATENGETRTYYLFAADAETSPNYSKASGVMVETIPTVPQEPVVTVGDSQVEIAWDGLVLGTDDNTDGFNIYRCDGDTFVPATCIRVNDILIHRSTPLFDDSIGNVTNRRPPAEVPYPVNGQIYTYRIEAEDTDTAWDIGTKNADVETGVAQPVASKVI